jgi:predicted component of type VI protein secretion system
MAWREAKSEAQMETKDAFPAQVLMMVGVALEELQRSEAETDLTRIRSLIMDAQSTLIELHELAAKTDGNTPPGG